MHAEHHAIVLPIPYQGHINPLLHLSLRLSHVAGFTITFLNTEANHARIIHSASSLPSRIRLLPIPDGLPSHQKGDVRVTSLRTLIHQISGSIDKLVGSLMHDAVLPPVTCIIYDMFMPNVAQIAHKYGIPSVAFFPQSAASFCCHYLIARAFSIQDGIPATDFSASHLHSIIGTIPGVPDLKWADNISYLQCADPSNYLFNFMTLPFKHMHEPSIVVVNSCEGLEDCSMLKELDVLSVGPMLPFEYTQDLHDVEEKQHISFSLWQEDNECLRWLEMQKPASVVYVSYGSVAVMSMKQLEEFAEGLRATGMPVLWMLRRDAIVIEDCSEFRESMVDGMMRGASHYIASWTPQPQVLSHPSTGVFLTHCGWNSTVESIAQGIPMVGWPWVGDQKLDCRMIVDKWKIGVMLEADEEGIVRRREVEQKVRRVMEGKTFRDRAAELKRVACKAVKEGKEVRILMERIEKIVKTSKAF